MGLFSNIISGIKAEITGTVSQAKKDIVGSIRDGITQTVSTVKTSFTSAAGVSGTSAEGEGYAAPTLLINQQKPKQTTPIPESLKSAGYREVPYVPEEVDPLDISEEDNELVEALGVKRYLEIKNKTSKDSLRTEMDRSLSPDTRVSNDAHQVVAGTRTRSLLEDVSVDNRLSIGLPDWGYKDFINERASWQKGLDTLAVEPGWFYFKIFFQFDTSFGLFGGILKDHGKDIMAENSALTFLTSNAARLTKSQIPERRLALYKFVGTLSYISSTAPWFFKQISGLDQAMKHELNNIVQERTIDIECQPDAIDMRLTSLYEYYKYACYDYVNQREVIPENLRKFNMNIVIFHTPIKYFHTAIKSITGGKAPYKSLNASSYFDRMSFQMISLQNCEFVTDSMNSITAGISNEQAFNLNSTIKIKYDRAYTTNLNEYAQTMIGSLGFGWAQNDEGMPLTGDIYTKNNGINVASRGQSDMGIVGPETEVVAKRLPSKNPYENSTLAHETNDTSQKARIRAMEYAKDHPSYFNPKATLYKSIIDASEDTISNAMRVISAKDAFGNLYGNFGPDSAYYRAKLEQLKTGNTRYRHTDNFHSNVGRSII